MTTQKKNDFHWRCILNPNTQYPYCSFKINFRDDGTLSGIDLSNVQGIELDYDYVGNENDTIRVLVRSVIPGLSASDDSTSLKHNQIEFRPSRYKSPIAFLLTNFNVAQWGLLDYDVSLEQSRVDFSEVYSFEITTGSACIEGEKYLA